MSNESDGLDEGLAEKIAAQDGENALEITFV
jgi:hypothetical protein